MVGKRYSLFVVALACMFAGSADCAWGQEDDTEYTIKTKYLFRFPTYVTWPKDTSKDGKFIIGILGKDPFEDALDAFAKKNSIQGKKVEVLRFKTAADYRPCHILFVASESEKDDKAKTPRERLEAVLKNIKAPMPLIVGDTEGLAKHGAIINFFIDNNNVKFEINQKAAERAELKINAKLLKVGRVVTEEEGR